MAQSRSQFGGDVNPILGSSEGIRPPEQLHGGFGKSAFTPTWSFLTNVASPLTHQPRHPSLGARSTPFLQQGFNASIPSHAAAQQYQWNTGNHFPPMNNLGALPSFYPMGFPCSDSMMDLSSQGQLSGITSRNNQSTIPPVAAQVVGGAYVYDQSGEF